MAGLIPVVPGVCRCCSHF